MSSSLRLVSSWVGSGTIIEAVFIWGRLATGALLLLLGDSFARAPLCLALLLGFLNWSVAWFMHLPGCDFALLLWLLTTLGWALLHRWRSPQSLGRHDVLESGAGRLGTDLLGRETWRRIKLGCTLGCHAHFSVLRQLVQTWLSLEQRSVWRLFPANFDVGWQKTTGFRAWLHLCFIIRRTELLYNSIQMLHFDDKKANIF